MQELLGLEDANSIKAVSGMGGGIAGRGEVCGALTGAVAALGLALGTHLPSQERNPRLRELACQLCEDFEQEWGSVLCRVVRPLAEARLGARDVAKGCTVLVRYVAEEVARLLMENASCECEADGN